MCTKIRLLLLICPFISSFFFLSNFQLFKSFLSLFIRNCEVYKVESRYTRGQLVDVACRLESDCSSFFVFLHFSFSPILFFFFFFVSPISKDYKLASTKLFQHTADGYGRGYVSFAHYLLYFKLAHMFFWINFYS